MPVDPSSLTIVHYPDPVLRETGRDVDPTDENVRDSLRLYRTLRADMPDRAELQRLLIAYIDQQTDTVLASEDYALLLGHFARMSALLAPIDFERDALPEAYRASAYVALHGSWNRTRKSGYKVVRLEWDGGGEIRETDFVWGFEVDEDVIGRPVDVVEGPDGALYVSDDYTGAVYRVAWAGG